ncbi:MAG TPA: hypothetical protein VFD92_04645 [Candidatus Binatia bacterium]|nr:hypothetical protein [Candidatus Binatia bacterium]
MATELLPSGTGSFAGYSTIWTKNLLWQPGASLVGVGTEDEFHPASYVMDPARHLRCWPITGGAFYFDFDLGTAQTWKGLSLIDCNLAASQGSAVELWAHNTFANLGTTTGTYRKWTYGTRTVVPDRGVDRWFIGADDTSQANNTAFRYARVKIIGTKISTDISPWLAAPWLGDWYQIPVGSIQVSAVETSQMEESFNRTPYVDSLPVKLDLNFSTDPIDESVFWALRRELLRIGGSQHVIFDRFSQSTDDNRRAASGHYGLLSIAGPWEETVEAPNTVSLSMKFNEHPLPIGPV